MPSKDDDLVVVVVVVVVVADPQSKADDVEMKEREGACAERASFKACARV
jgi:hypothetical protein